jgi:TPP-dependent pyruvate/acetoin dehydrogenase alpha subunit
VTLVAFEERVADAFNRGEIRAPIHLSRGNEEQLIRYFDANFRPGDWVFSTWRSHLHALLAGVPEAEVFDAVMAGKSITLCFPARNFFSSAIVGGHLPLALGVAMGVKRRWNERCKHGVFARNWCWQRDEYALHGSVEPDNERSPKVHVFLGDMAAMTGTFHEVHRYALGHDLPISFVVEDNGLSVMTDTQEVWGPLGRATGESERALITRYTYDLKSYFPHSGAGHRIEF